MIHGNFGKHSAAGVKLPHQLNAGGAAARKVSDALQNTPADKSKITIDISDRQLKEFSCNAIINLANNFAATRICASRLITVNDVDFVSHERNQSPQLIDVVLAITVCVENKLLGSVTESCLQRRSVT